MSNIGKPGENPSCLIINWEAGKRVVDPLVRIEFGREIATIIMLIAVGRLAGKDRLQRLCLRSVYSPAVY